MGGVSSEGRADMGSGEKNNKEGKCTGRGVQRGRKARGGRKYMLYGHEITKSLSYL